MSTFASFASSRPLRETSRRGATILKKMIPSKSSPEGTTDVSPRRKPWVAYKTEESPFRGDRNRLTHFGCGYAALRPLRETRRRGALAALVLLSSAVVLTGQAPSEQNTPSHPPRKPDVENLHYGPAAMQDLDLYLAKSAKPAPLVLYFFPGGFVVGNKNTVSPYLLDSCKKAGITVAAIDYRYIKTAPFPGPFLDAARALQFLRLHAREYNIDPGAVASTGSSAGADISLWIGFHKDQADPASDDPLKRQSTRISAVGALAAQTSLDPRVVAKLIDENDAKMFAKTFYGLGPDQATWDHSADKFNDVSAAANVAKDNPPVFLYYSVPNQPITAETPRGDRVHNPAFGFYLKERMDKIGVECLLRLRSDYPGENPGPKVNQDMVEFFLRHFPKAGNR
jgi:acetyl esterase/lipase